MFRANNFDKLLDKATSNLRLDPDWPTILQICDLIRQNDCTPKYAIAAVKKKLYSQNPHQAMFALLTLESIVKNCGSAVHDEVASKPFCEMLTDLVKTTQHENLRSKILELIQAWAFAFRNSPKYRAVQDTVNILKAESYKFPPLKESDAMFSADSAPEWANGEVCHRCRVAFSMIVRRHHCRACGQIFCQQCSAKTSTLPKFGIEKEVRVCNACFDKVSRPPSSTSKFETTADTSNVEFAPIAQPQKKPGKSAEELQEEEELQLALALSQSEAEHKEKEKKTKSKPSVVVQPAAVLAPSPVSTTEPELARYLDRGYWEQRAAPTAPQEYAKSSKSTSDEEDAEDKEIDEFVTTLKSQVEIFVNRMKSNSSRGRSITNDTAVQSLFVQLTTLHSRLLHYIQQQDDKRVFLEGLQDKLGQLRDSRAALDTLRAEHVARRAAQAAAADRQRQLQMMHKLDAMRKKKHDYLQYQRQLALQRVQEQEREMQMRQEQQKHQYMMSATGGYFMPTVSHPQYQTGFQNQPIYANPQFPMMPPTTDPTQPNMPNPGTQSMPTIPHTPGPPQPTQTMHQRPLSQQMSMPPMMMQQMQMRMPGQAGIHQFVSPNSNGYVPPHNNQAPKQNQQQVPNSIATNMPHAQGMQTNVTNPMMGVQMPNVRMVQGNQHQPVPGYPMTNQPNAQIQGLPGQQVPQQMHVPGQQLPLHNQTQNLPGQGQNPHKPNLPQGTLPQSGPGQIPQSIANQTTMIPGQQLNMQMIPGQQPPPGPNLPQNINQTPQMLVSGQQLPQNQQIHSQNQQYPGQVQAGQIQHLPSQTMPHQAPPQQIPHNQPQQILQGHPSQMAQGPQPQMAQGPNPIQQSHPQGMPQTQSQIPPQGQTQSILQGQPIPQGQPLPQGHPLPQSQTLPQGQPIPQGQTQAVPQGLSVSQVQSQQMMSQGQALKMPPATFPTTTVPQPLLNQPVKSEHSSSTAELISFD